MDMIFEFDQRQGLTRVRFDGLTGTESVTSVKGALDLLKIRNPATTFAEAVQALKYDNVPDEEYIRMLETIKFLSTMWRYTDDPGDAPQKYEMNVLMLLANALEALSQFNVQYQMPLETEPQ